ncbi:MAG: KH domain-containing protein [Myxococcota bacterium]
MSEESKQELEDEQVHVAQVMDLLMRFLVDDPDQVELSRTSGRQTTVLEVKVGKTDHGKIVGRRGRTADAIRNLLKCMGGKSNHRFLLEILE